jgi:Family of unknown function (DUF5317)
MLVLVATILALVSPLLLGGQLSRLAFVKLRFWWLLFSALIAQILIIEIFPDANETLLDAVHLATYVIAGVFVAVNWQIPGLLVIALGGAANGITIALNGGTLPASASALEMAGIDAGTDEFVNSGVLENPTLSWLGDIFVWPEPMPFANVFSIGDLLIVIGAFYGANKICGSRLVKRSWVPAHGDVPWAADARDTLDTDATEDTKDTEHAGDAEESRDGKSPREEAPLGGEAR